MHNNHIISKPNIPHAIEKMIHLGHETNRWTFLTGRGNWHIWAYTTNTGTNKSIWTNRDSSDENNHKTPTKPGIWTPILNLAINMFPNPTVCTQKTGWSTRKCWNNWQWHWVTRSGFQGWWTNCITNSSGKWKGLFQFFIYCLR